MFSKTKWMLLGLAMLALPVTIVLAEGRSQRPEPAGRVGAYHPSTVTEAYRSSIAVLDTVSAVHADILAIEKVYAGGFTTIAVAPRFSAASATARIRVVRYTSADTVKGYSTATATADDADTDGTLYLAPSLYFDTEGAPYVRVLTDAPSSGTVTLWVESN